MIIVGLNVYHGDAAAALLIDGQVAAAIEEERFTRIKHWSGMPRQAIESCLNIAGITPDQVDHWTVNSDNRVHRFRKMAYLFSGQGSVKLAVNRLRHRSRRKSVAEELSEIFQIDYPRFSFHAVEHHLCHLASAYYPSGYDNALVLSIDGFGDFSSAAWGYGSQRGVASEGYVHFPHSLGIFYQAITQFLGFLNYGDEYKVMGLASYGETSYYDRLRQIVKPTSLPGYALDLAYFRHHNESIAHNWEGGAPVFDQLYSTKLEELLGAPRRKEESIEQRHRDIAASAQRLYEECLFEILNKLSGKDGTRNLALAGGCAMNSVANGKISQSTPFENIYIQPAAGDAGGAIGAALVVHQKLSESPVSDPMPNAYLGPAYGDADIANLLRGNNTKLAEQRCTTMSLPFEELITVTVSALIEGKVVGWFQGRMEWGARALGNRSILCDPRRADIQSMLNAKIKRRESFRPFAPSILREYVSEWFEIDDAVPYMQKVYPIRKEKRTEIPAVTHVDGTGRLQTVTRSQNALYYRLISHFNTRTGVPILLNTSFNENEPIVCRPEEALDCFLRTRMDVLVMGKHIIRRGG